MIQRALIALGQLVAPLRGALRWLSALSSAYAATIPDGHETLGGDRVAATLAAARAWRAEVLAMADSPAPALSWWLGRAAADERIRRTFARALQTRADRRAA